jgi:sugar lactone lactonase YvrE
MNSINCVLEHQTLLGESPIWSAEEQALYFVDIHRPAIHRFKPTNGELSTWPMAEHVGSIGFRASGGLIAAFRRNFAVVNTVNGTVQPLQSALFAATDLRFNDGRCDRRGRFWSGTVQENRKAGLASLFCLDAHGNCKKMLDGLTVSNGISWSPDDRVMYLADSWDRSIYAFDFDLAQGSIANRRLFAQFPDHAGIPDGATVDTEGCYWIAHFDGWRISRYTPRGELDRVIEFPVPRPTSCAFGGPDLKTLYVTSASFNLSPEQRAAAPLSGSLFALDVEAQGLAEPVFASESVRERTPL